MAALPQIDVQETAIRTALGTVSLPEGIKLHHLEFHHDSTGDPAVYAVYSFTMAGRSDGERGKDLSSVSEGAANAILDLELPLFPYTTFIEA